MNWIDGMKSAIDYIEDNLTEELSIEEAAARAYVSQFYFQKAFAMLCGMTVGEYIRSRRLALAGTELMTTDNKIIDIAVKHGYDSPDSFTKAFTRFHGVTPTAVRKNGATVKSFAPLRIKFSLEGGITMEYKITEKQAFTVIGARKSFKYDSAYGEIPKFWDEHYKAGKGEIVCGMFGISIDTGKVAGEFDYLIADNYTPWLDVPDGFETYTFPKQTWAVFISRGPLPGTFQELNTKIFSEWLPNSKEYEIADKYSIELYSNPKDFPEGNKDKDYYAELWIPVKKK